jgi:hypothetical protein
MDPGATPGIEVATVKPSSVDAQGRLYTMHGAQLVALNVSVMNVANDAAASGVAH